MKQVLSTPIQLGQILVSARRAAGLTQAKVAVPVGVSQSRLSAMELDPGSMNVDQLLGLMAAYGLELVVQTRGADEAVSISSAW